VDLDVAVGPVRRRRHRPRDAHQRHVDVDEAEGVLVSAYSADHHVVIEARSLLPGWARFVVSAHDALAVGRVHDVNI